MGWNHNKIWDKHPAVTKGKDRTIGQRSADRMKMMLATWIALILVLVGIVVWMIYNSYVSGQHVFDPYPWILLNLCLSCFAALQCFVLLIANKRGEQIAAEIAQHTYENTCSDAELLRENTELTRDVKKNTDLLKELTKAVAELSAPVVVVVEEEVAATPVAKPAAKPVPTRRKRTPKPKTEL